MYSNNIVNFQESTTILNALQEKSGYLLIHHVQYNILYMIVWTRNTEIFSKDHM